MRFVIHVAPQNLRESEVDNENLPVWVLRPLADLTQFRIVDAVRIDGAVDTVTSRMAPLPNTGGHGWAYLVTASDARVIARRTPFTPFVDASELFTGTCCTADVHAIFTRARQTIPANDRTSDDSPSADGPSADGPDVDDLHETVGETPDQAAFDAAKMAETDAYFHLAPPLDPITDHLRGPSF